MCWLRFFHLDFNCLVTANGNRNIAFLNNFLKIIYYFPCFKCLEFYSPIGICSIRNTSPKKKEFNCVYNWLIAIQAHSFLHLLLFIFYFIFFFFCFVSFCLKFGFLSLFFAHRLQNFVRLIIIFIYQIVWLFVRIVSSTKCWLNNIFLFDSCID